MYKKDEEKSFTNKKIYVELWKGKINYKKFCR